jgi:flagellar hook-associated protein 2
MATTTGTISSLGVGSGLDVNGIITKLMSVEQQPLTDLQTADTGLKTQLSSYGQMQSLVSTLQTNAQALSSLTLWKQTAATSADTSVVSASTSSGAAAGNYSVTVQQLASGQTVTSSAYASDTTTVGSGTLSIQLGSYSGGPPATSFSAGTGSAVAITVAATDTLANIRDKINAAGAGVGATIINDVNGARLSLTSTATGAASGFQITASSGVSALGFDATNAASPMSLNQSAVNAKATVNGIAIESATNTMANVASGLTLTLSKLSATPVQVNVATDTSAVSKAVTDFVSAFNGVASFISTQTAYDATAKKGGPLLGDSTTNSLQWGLRGIINQASTASSVFSTLSSVGISMQADGTLSVDQTKLGNALNNLPELQKLFSADTGVSASSGFMTRFSNLANAALGIDGSITTRQQGLQTSISSNEKRQADMTTRLAQIQANLTAQYSQLDTTMAQMTALSNYVTQQFSTKTA